ncbi:hypothetical protein BH92_27980 (plasmid) [Rhodococcoides fascians A21d2]|jgi:hypothetical protein|uniref:hypothetical protein n=1 Tax=Rhodococcoides fascians TaxID=1828 RepID=UPI000A3F2EAA|nr:hypothetical protein [Rhodococcus fascians]QII03903.1 hypothetical protein BH92_27980 [Rhodococcus fascians A21d2]
MESAIDVSTVRMAGSAKPISDAYVATFKELVEMLVLNPTVKQLLAAGFTHAQTARTMRIRKQQVGVLARTPFHPVTMANKLHSIDVWALAQSLWDDSEGRLQLAIDAAFEWDATQLTDIALPQGHPEQYRIGSVADEVDTYGCAFARCEAARPYTPRQEDVDAARVGALRARAAGATELDLRACEDDMLEFLRTPVVSEVPDFLYRHPHRHSAMFDHGKPWEKRKFEERAEREQDEMKRYGTLLPTLPDDSTDPRVLARDILLFNFGDLRVLDHHLDADPLDESRARVLEKFAGELGVRWDQWQTFGPENRPAEDVESEIRQALEAHLGAVRE